MVYMRVSNMFDYSLHVLVPLDLNLDISISGYTFCFKFCCAFYFISAMHAFSIPFASFLFYYIMSVGFIEIRFLF